MHSVRIAFALALVPVAHSAAQRQYAITDLTEAAAPLGVLQCEARAINETGQIVGFELVDAFHGRAIAWEADGAARILGLLPDDNSSYGYGITASGAPLGVSELVTIEMVGHQIRITLDQKAVICDFGEPVTIASLVMSGPDIELLVAQGANATGHIVGDGRIGAAAPFEPRGWLLRGGELIDLGALQRPRAINDAGVIAGHTASSQSKAYVWDAGVLTNLHDHPSIGGVKSEAWDINSRGQVVGQAQFDISHPEQAALWEDGAVTDLLQPRFGRPQSTALAINEAGDIIGYVNDLDVLGDQTRAFLLTAAGDYYDLIDLVPEARAQGWDQLIIGFDMNERGQIVGGGMRYGELGHGFLLTPLCRADLTGDGALDLFDFLEFQNLFAAGDLRADFTGDGALDLFDFLAFQNEFAAGCP
ncbi:MAG: GC-type dockerin domain-anchored protein [Phycisphaerales bacterium JB039]